MALFPTDAKDGEIFAAANGKNYVYQGEKNVWQSTDCVPKWADQVYIRGIDNTTQQNVNDTNQEVNVKVGNVATATNQLLDVAFDVRCRGIWIYQGGAVAPGDPPVGLQRFLMTDAEGNKTQEYSEAASLTIHAMGAGQLDKISIGETELGDLITIQNSRDLGGGSYIVTAIEEFHNDNPDELTETYAVYTVAADAKRCSGSVAAEEKAVIRIIPQQAVPALEDEYLPLTGGSMKGDIAMGGHKVSGVGDPTADAQAANKRYVDARLKRTGGTSQKMEGMLYMGGHKIAGVGDPESSDHAANRRFVEQQIAAIPEPEAGGGGPTTKYDGNRFCVGSDRGTPLNDGEVRFMTISGNNVTNIASIQRVGLPANDFDWSKCTKAGVLKVKNGPTVVGWLHVYDVADVDGDKELWVKLVQVGDTNTVDVDSGVPCYFQGVFFE